MLDNWKINLRGRTQGVAHGGVGKEQLLLLLDPGSDAGGPMRIGAAAADEPPAPAIDVDDQEYAPVAGLWELREAVACIQIIETCYRSSAEGSRELPLPLDVTAL